MIGRSSVYTRATPLLIRLRVGQGSSGTYTRVTRTFRLCPSGSVPFQATPAARTSADPSSVSVSDDDSYSTITVSERSTNASPVTRRRRIDERYVATEILRAPTREYTPRVLNRVPGPVPSKIYTQDILTIPSYPFHSEVYLLLILPQECTTRQDVTISDSLWSG